MLTSELLLPVAGNLTLLSLGGLLALGSSASALTRAQAAVTTGGHTDTPLPFPTVRLLRLFLCVDTRNQAGEVVSTQSLQGSSLSLTQVTAPGRVNTEDIHNTVGLKAEHLTSSSQFCRERSKPLSPKHEDHANSVPLPCLLVHLEILKCAPIFRNLKAHRDHWPKHAGGLSLSLQQLVACKYSQLQLKHCTLNNEKCYVLILCIRGFEHLQGAAVGCNLLVCYTMSHFITEYEQNFKGKAATWRSIFEVLLIQVSFLLRDKRKDHYFI